MKNEKVMAPSKFLPPSRPFRACCSFPADFESAGRAGGIDSGAAFDFYKLRSVAMGEVKWCRPISSRSGTYFFQIGMRFIEA